jgi:hypothetical protein
MTRLFIAEWLPSRFRSRLELKCGSIDPQRVPPPLLTRSALIAPLPARSSLPAGLPPSRTLTLSRFHPVSETDSGARTASLGRCHYLLLLLPLAVHAEDLGELSANPYDSESTSNPYGRYGSPYSPDSIKNPFGAGNPYNPSSPTNPYGHGLHIEGR